MIYEVLPSTNLRADDIRDTIGIASNNLSHFVVKAKKGGTGGYAFRIKENGFARTDGTLIDGAEPYFNIYSNFSPVEWLPYTPAGQSLPTFRCRLKRHKGAAITVGGETVDTNCYAFDLGEFAGYRHGALPPAYRGENNQYVNYDDPSDGVYIYFNPGSIYWYKYLGQAGSNYKYGCAVSAGQTFFAAGTAAATGDVLIKARPAAEGNNAIEVTAGLYTTAGALVARIPIDPFILTVDWGHGQLTAEQRRFKGISFTRTNNGVSADLAGLAYSKTPRATISQWGDFSITVDIDRSKFPWVPGPAGGGEIWADLYTTIFMPRPGELPHLEGSIKAAVGITDNMYYNTGTFTVTGKVPGWDSSKYTAYTGVSFRLDIVKA